MRKEPQRGYTVHKGVQMMTELGFRFRESGTCALNLCAMELPLLMTRKVSSPHSHVAKMLTSLITLLNVAGPRLDGGALAPVVEAVAGAATLLDPVATRCRTGGPLRPWGPAIVRRVTGCRGDGFIQRVVIKTS